MSVFKRNDTITAGSAATAKFKSVYRKTIFEADAAAPAASQCAPFLSNRIFTGSCLRSIFGKIIPPGLEMPEQFRYNRI